MLTALPEWNSKQAECRFKQKNDFFSNLVFIIVQRYNFSKEEI